MDADVAAEVEEERCVGSPLVVDKGDAIVISNTLYWTAEALVVLSFCIFETSGVDIELELKFCAYVCPPLAVEDPMGFFVS